MIIFASSLSIFVILCVSLGSHFAYLFRSEDVPSTQLIVPWSNAFAPPFEWCHYWNCVVKRENRKIFSILSTSAAVFTETTSTRSSLIPQPSNSKTRRRVHLEQSSKSIAKNTAQNMRGDKNTVEMQKAEQKDGNYAQFVQETNESKCHHVEHSVVA